MKKILTFGEILLRMSPSMGGKWIEDAIIPTFVGGAELNVAAALASWHIPVAYYTALPDQNALADEILSYLKSKNIETNSIPRSGERIGIYYLPQGADLKNTGVIYDRANSSFAALKPNELDWDSILENVEWFHLSAISPALNQSTADLCLEAVKIAAEKNIKISIDLNFRSKLWKYGKKPIEIIPEIANYCDLIMGNIWAAHQLLGIPIDPEVARNNATKEEYLNQAETSGKSIFKQFPKCKLVANTFRFDHGKEGINYYTTLQNPDLMVVSPHFEKEKVIDKIGSGDCFMAGLLYGLYKNLTLQETVNFASAAAIGKLNEIGDFTQQTSNDIEKILTLQTQDLCQI